MALIDLDTYMTTNKYFAYRLTKTGFNYVKMHLFQLFQYIFEQNSTFLEIMIHECS